MTILDIKNQLVTHFFNSDVFAIGGQEASTIKFSDDLAPFRDQALRAALLELELAGIVKKLGNPDGDAWVLHQSFGSVPQTVVISPQCAEWLGNTINGFREAHDLDEDACDKTRITENDIVNLLSILHQVMEYEAESEDGEAGFDKN